MKTKSQFPWLPIAGIAAAVVYGLTLAIAWDQVRQRDEEIAELAARLKNGTADLAEAKKRGVESSRRAAEWEDRATGLAASTQALIDSSETLKRLKDQRIADLESRLAASEAAAAPVRRAVGTYAAAPMPVVPTASATAPPVIPQWVPPAPSVVAASIRDLAQKENPGDFPAINYEIERQTEAFEKVVRYYKTADPFIKAAINKAALDHGTRYSSIAYEVDRQIEARQKFTGR